MISIDMIYLAKACLFGIMALAILAFSLAARAERLSQQKIPKQVHVDVQYWSVVTATLALLAAVLIDYL
jgi:hypothetical protein